MDCYTPINKQQYLALRCQVTISKALPCMCVLVIKPNKDGNPHHVKSHIIVLGNFEDQIYFKADKYAPVLGYSSVHLLAVQACTSRRTL